MTSPEQTPEQTPGGDEMLDAADPERTPEQIIAEALHAEWSMVAKDLRARWEGPFPFGWSPGVPENWLARHSLAALHSNGVLVFSSEADVWAWVRERLLTDEAADACWEGYADARDEGEDEPAVVMRRGLAAAIDHAAAADQGKEGKG